MDEEKVYPGKELPEEVPPDPKPEEKPKEDPPKEEPKEDPKPEAKPEPEKDKEPPKEPEPLPKKRSIYDDFKEEKGRRKTAEQRATEAEAKVAELEALLDKKDEAKTPGEKAKADDDIQAFIDKHNGEQLTAESLTELAQIIAGRVKPGDLPEEVKEKLKFLDALQADQKRLAEDAETRKSVSLVKKQLEISEDAELEAVMNEIVRLTHTDEFHDKEVEYIVWKNKEALSKLVSPKKPSFESGDTKPEGEGDAEIDFSKPVTPEQAQKGMIESTKPRGVEIVKPK